VRDAPILPVLGSRGGAQVRSERFEGACCVGAKEAVDATVQFCPQPDPDVGPIPAKAEEGQGDTSSGRSCPECGKRFTKLTTGGVLAVVSSAQGLSPEPFRREGKSDGSIRAFPPGLVQGRGTVE